MFTYFNGAVSALPGADAGYGGINLTELLQPSGLAVCLQFSIRSHDLMSIIKS